MKNLNKGFVPVIVIAIIALAAVGGGSAWYVSSHKSANTKVEVPETTTSVEITASTTVSTDTTKSSDEKISSLEAAFAQGKDVICTFNIKDPNTESSGTFYISNKNIRGDFSSANKMIGQTVTAHTIIDEKFSYTWTDISPMGFKVPIVGTPAQAVAGAQAQFQANGAAGNYDCKAWTKDASKFTLPTSVKFMETPSGR